MELADKWKDKDYKWCAACQTTKRLADFILSSKSGRLYPSTSCRECDSRARSAKNKELRKDEVYRLTAIAKTKGITLDEYASQMIFQESKCAICDREVPLHLDHDHACCDSAYSCGECNRGFLCQRCNNLLGAVGDDPDLLRKAASYLDSKGIWERFTGN